VGWRASADIACRPCQAAQLIPLDPSDPTAKGLGFVTDASKVDAKANSTFKAGEQLRRVRSVSR
jgi:hypothetical protein